MINQGRLECKYNPLVPEQQAFLQLTCQQHDSLHLPKNKIEALENTWPKITHNVKGKLYWSSRLLLSNEAFELFIAFPPPELLKTVIFLIHFKTVNIINCIYRMHFRLPPEGAPAAAADQDTPDECANHAQSLPLQWSGTCFGVIHFPEFVIQFWGKYVTQVGQSGNRLGCRFFVLLSILQQVFTLKKSLKTSGSWAVPKEALKEKSVVLSNHTTTCIFWIYTLQSGFMSPTIT